MARDSAQYIRLAAAQINPIVGDIPGNTEKIRETLEQARKQQVQMVAFPEMALSGYPPRDLLLKTQYLEDLRSYMQQLIPETKGLTAIIGTVIREQDVFNAAAVIHDGHLLGYVPKTNLPNYRVFDEKRYFRSGRERLLFETDLLTFGVVICEDLWHPRTVARLAECGMDLLVAISASPFNVGKPEERRTLLSARATDHNLAVLYCNQVGGQDELVFDGRSMVVDPDGSVLGQAKAFEEDFLITDVYLEELRRHRLAVPLQRDWREDHDDPPRRIRSSGSTLELKAPARALDISKNPFVPKIKEYRNDPIEDVYQALVLGVRDYVGKNGFRDVVIGLSGGIDSALVCTIAVDALGKDRVWGVFMPGRYSSDHSRLDAQRLAKNLEIRFTTIPIESVFQTYLDMLKKEFDGCEPDITEENLQARIRGATLMALSNKFGSLVLTTGNKSELAVGYATLYGDMCGGLAVISDVPKTWVYRLALYRNERDSREIIPQSILEKAPSAELRPDQKDTDTLPDYEELDGILHAYIELEYSCRDIVGLGYSAETVRRVIRMVDRAEYKRRQAAIGIRVTTKAFGTDRRLPVTNQFREFPERE
ncbi:MAG TPA: NAD+ synthase [bacterium]|nr:NAD+ synthase [bacterium]